MKEIEALQLVLAMAEGFGNLTAVHHKIQKMFPGQANNPIEAQKIQDKAISIVDALVAGIGKIQPMEAVKDTLREEGIHPMGFIGVNDVHSQIEGIIAEEYSQMELTDTDVIFHTPAQVILDLLEAKSAVKDNEERLLDYEAELEYEVAKAVIERYIANIADAEEPVKEAAE